MGKKLVIFFVVVLVGVYFATDYFKKQSRISQKITQKIKTPTALPRAASEIVKIGNLRILEDAVKRYKYEKGRFPEMLDEMVSSGYIDRIPEGKWEYDSLTGELK